MCWSVPHSFAVDVIISSILGFFSIFSSLCFHSVDAKNGLKIGFFFFFNERKLCALRIHSFSL